jgi:hypothetical protein
MEATIMAYRHRRMGRPDPSAVTLARGLGWFSIALGAVELAAPRFFTRNLGMRGQENMIRGYGLREVAAGIGILASRDPTPWVFARIAGDGLDLATLGLAYGRRSHRRDNIGVALASVAGVTLLDAVCAQMLTAAPDEPRLPMRDYSRRSGLPRPPDEMRGAARDTFELPRDMMEPPAMHPPQGGGNPVQPY